VSPARILRAPSSPLGQQVVALLVLLSIVAVLVLTFQQQRQVECNARYNERKAASDQARAEAYAEDKRALEKMVRDLLEPNQPPGNGRKILDEYLATIAESDRKRAEHPVPAPPPNLCR
jgi:hypothetical protein